jgi:hypothetical protein
VLVAPEGATQRLSQLVVIAGSELLARTTQPAVGYVIAGKQPQLAGKHFLRVYLGR